jgi:hypothetical protein
MDHGLNNTQHQAQASNIERVIVPVKKWMAGVKERAELLVNDPLKALDQSLSDTYPLYDKVSKADQEDVLRKVQQAQSNPSTQEPDRGTINALINSTPLGGIAGATERVVGKAAKNAIQIAREGGKHSGQLNQFLKQTPEQLQKTIKSFDKQIANHEAWIKAPTLKVNNFYELRPEHQQNLLHHWQQDIARHNELKAIAEDVLKGL